MSGYRRSVEQAAVITHPDEPLRVAAGAGTGKTATMTDRLVRLIESGVPPEAALGITFTNKAAEELADRLRAALPGLAADGREVEVTTYHGFAYRLLQEFGAFVGVEHNVEVIGPGYARQLLLESLDGASYVHLDMAAPAQRVADAATLASQLGDNLLTAADLLATAPAEPDPPWPQRIELAGIISRYEQAKAGLGVADYTDLIRWAHQLVTDHRTVADRVRRRYRAVVLDEYQDTAPAQRELLRTLFGDGFPITAVGDSDQTIYEWRGASRQNFDGFPGHFPTADGTEAATLTLSVNHRSGSTILDVAHAVRQQVHGPEVRRLDPGKDAPTGRVHARWFRTAVDEATWLASETKYLHEVEDLPWADMAVLFRKNHHMALVRDAFAVAGIPVEVASLGGLLDVPEVADLVGWLRLLHRRDDTVSLARILTGSRYRLGLADLSHLVSWAAREGLFADVDDLPGWPLLEAIDRLDEIEDLRSGLRQRLHAFRSLYRSLLTEAQGVALVELCRLVLDGIDAWEEIEAMEPAAALSARLNLYRFLDLVQGWSPLWGRPSLDAFLLYLELLQSDAAADELDTARVGGSEAVSLLSVHRAKGLEWDTVFLPALASGIFPATSLGYDNPLAYARYLPYEMRLDVEAASELHASPDHAKDLLRDRHLAAEWRTAYVAITRAKRSLYASGSYWYGGKKPKSPSDLFELVAAVPLVEQIRVAPEPGDRPDRLGFSSAQAIPDALFASGWPDALRTAMANPESVRSLVVDHSAYDAAVDQLRLLVDGLPKAPVDDQDVPAVIATSVTGLVTLAGCPARFYWSEVDPLPRRPSAAMKRGVDLHRQIELHNRGAIAFDEISPALYDVPASSAQQPSAKDGFGVFQASRFAARTPRFIETAIDLEIGPARVRGRIDAVYADDDGTWEIVDYKSGRDHGSDTAVVQLEAYAVAAVSGAIGPDPPNDIRATFLYLGGDDPHEVTYRADGDWLSAATQRLEDLAHAATGTEFAATPGPACRHCDFLKFCEPGQSFVAQLSP